MTDDHPLSVERRRILTEVAAGRLSPAEASVQLDVLDEAARLSDAAEVPVPPVPPIPPTPPTDPGAEYHWEAPRRGERPAAERPADRRVGDPSVLRLVSVAGAVKVIADDSVAQVQVEGAHTLEESGDELKLTCGVLAIEPGSPWAADGFQIHLGRRSINFPSTGRDLKTVVRMNPAMALRAEVSAGSLVVSGVPSVDCDVNAGSAKITDFDGPLRCRVAAGSVSAKGRIASGHSEVNCDAGSVRLVLSDDSDVTINVQANLGRISIDGERGTFRPGERGERTMVVGAGHAALDVVTNLGNVSVYVSDDDE